MVPLLAGATLALGAVLSWPGPHIVGGTPPAVQPGSRDVKSLIRSNQAFAFDFLRASIAADPGRANVAFSPHSIATAIAMAHAGARDATRRQIADAMRFPLPSPELDAALADLAASLAPGQPSAFDRQRQLSPFQLTVANRFWADGQLEVLPEFREALRRHYGADLAALNFSDAPAAADTINRWVHEQTKGRIARITSPAGITPRGAIITNAVYFKGAWSEQFAVAATHDGAFNLGAGRTATVKMMRRTAFYPYAKTDLGQVLRLDFVGGAEMLIILPAEDRTDKAIGSLTPELLEQTVAKLAYNEVRLSLPRISVSSLESVKQILGAMGIRAAFTDAADFSGISSSTALMIGDVKHAVDIRVDENGAEAAAATAVEMRPTSAPPVAEPAEMRVDRPFLLIIRHGNGQILFVAAVGDPRGTPAGQ